MANRRKKFFFAAGPNDKGGTWRALTTGLPQVPIYSLAVNPNKLEYLYAGTEVGVFASHDRGQTWTPTNRGPSNSPVYDLKFSGNALYAATFGRGLCSIEIRSAVGGP